MNAKQKISDESKGVSILSSQRETLAQLLLYSVVVFFFFSNHKCVEMKTLSVKTR